MAQLVPPARLVGAAVAIAAIGVGALVVGCSDDDDSGGGDGGAGDVVGDLGTVAEGDDLANAVDVTAGGGGVWVVLDDGQVVQVGDDDLQPVAALDPVSTDAGIAAGGDGTLFAADPDRRQLVTYREGEAETGAVPAAQELSELAAGPDGTVFVGDYDGLQLLSIGADGRVGELVDDVIAGPMTVAPDGTLYYVDDQLLDGRIVALAPGGGGPEGITRSVERDDDGDPVEAPSEGASPEGSYIDARDLAATDDGLYVLTFTNEVWRIGDDQLELVLRRGGDSALAALGASGDDVYVLDPGTETLSILGTNG
jgi:hypothetical protein